MKSYKGQGLKEWRETISYMEIKLSRTPRAIKNYRECCIKDKELKGRGKLQIERSK